VTPRLLLTVLLPFAPLAGQFEYVPDPEHLDSLTSRLEGGDATVRSRVEREGRALFIWAAQRRLSGSTAHLVARIGLLFGRPFTSADSTIPPSELFWRGGLVSALHGALAADSTDIWAAATLEEMAPYPHVWLPAEREFRQLRALGRAHDSLPLSLTLAWLGMELERGDPDTAAVALARVPREAIGAVRWQHLAAQVAFARGDSSASRLYREGARAIRDSRDAAIYRADIAWFAEEEELAEWDALAPDGGAHADWLDRFWTRRDLDDLRLPGTRLRDHFARWRLALRLYRWDVEAKRISGWRYVPTMGLEYNDVTDIKYPRSEFIESAIAYAGRYRPLSILLDDRGSAVMRHGPPDTEVELPGITGMGQTMMRWQQPGGALVMSFSRPGVMVSRGVSQPDALWGMIARNQPVGDLLAGCRVDAELCTLAGIVEAGGDFNNQSLRTRHRYDTWRRTAEVTEDNAERFDGALEAYAQAYGVPGGGVLVAYAIRASALTGGVAQVRVMVGDPKGGAIVSVLDTARQYRASTNPDAFIAGWVEVPSPIGDWQVNLVLADSARVRGFGARFDGVPVVAAVGSALRLGDPILGRPASGLRWSRRGQAIPLNPTGAWRRDEEAALSVEVFGLVAGRGYEVAIELLEGGGDDADRRLGLAERITATGAAQLIQRSLSFANLDTGDYRLVVRVTDTATGATVRRERGVAVR